MSDSADRKQAQKSVVPQPKETQDEQLSQPELSVEFAPFSTHSGSADPIFPATENNLNRLQKRVGNTQVDRMVKSGQLRRLRPSGGLPPLPGVIQAKPEEEESPGAQAPASAGPSFQGGEASPNDGASSGGGAGATANAGSGGGGSSAANTNGASSAASNAAPPTSASGANAASPASAASGANAPANQPQNGASAAGSSSGGSAGGGAETSAPSTTAENGASSEVDLLMPEPNAELSPEEQARIEGAQSRTGEAAANQADLPPGAQQVAGARQAVQEPQEEIEGRAGGQLASALGSQPGPSPEIEQLCTRIISAIKAKRPPDEDSLVEANPEEAARAAGGELNQAVQGDAQRVQGAYDSMDGQPQGAPTREPSATPPQPAPATSPAVDAASAAPDPVPAEEVSLDADVEANEQRMEEAGMNTEAAQLVESGPIAEARAAHGELEQTAQEDPAEVMAQQQAAISSAQTDMADLQARALAALQESRANAVTNTQGQQQDMVGSEEQMRARVGQQANQIFDRAQTQVNDLLRDLPQRAMTRWDTGVAQLSTQFRQNLNRVKEWVDERHEGIIGAVVELADNIFGYPDWIIDEYNKAEEAFGNGVCDLLREISAEVNGVIASCQAIIQQARDDIANLYASLPAELQGWAAQEQSHFNERLDALSAQANETRDTFNRDLRNRASQAVQEVRQEIHALREKAGGLVGRISNAINAFLEDPAKFIINGLLELVGIPPASFWALVNRISQVIDQIADDPMGFANNLVEALKQGFQRFFDNIGTHLLDGLLQWLFSGLGAVGVTVPRDFSLESIITFFLQVMGISWARIRTLLAKHIGEDNVALIERAWGMISELIEKGPAGIFEMIKEQLNPQAILDMVLQTAIDFMVETLIKQVTMRVIGMLNPAGAIVQAIEVIYKVLKWLFENASRIFSLVETIVNGIADVLAGNIGGLAGAIEQALARLLPIVIDFLADLLGLGDLPQKIADVIKRVQSFVEGILDRVIGWLAQRARGLLQAMGIGGEEEGAGANNDQQLAAASAALDAKQEREMDEGEISAEEAQAMGRELKTEQPDISNVTVTDGGDTWDYNFTFVQRAKAKKVPKSGKTKMDLVTIEFEYKRGYDRAEFQRQLDQQESGINAMKVSEWYANRQRFEDEGREEGESAWRRGMRDRMRAALIEHYTEDEGMTPGRAAQKADRELRKLAVLHKPDQVAGGEGVPEDIDTIFGALDEYREEGVSVEDATEELNRIKEEWFGSSRINSAIGRQWKTRARDLKDKADEIPEKQREKMNMNVKLNLS